VRDRGQRFQIRQGVSSTQACLQMGDDAVDTVALADLGNVAHGGLPL
jgi:hypothetical protein